MVLHQLFLSLGGNLGNKAEIFTQTLALIEKNIGILKVISPVYETSPWGFETEFAFWNQVLLVVTTLTPGKILREIQLIEKLYGRKRSKTAYLSRKMDIDILFFDNEIINSPELTIPHPMIAQRKFVLAPLADVTPDFVHPVTGLTIARMLAECTDLSSANRLKP